MRKAWLLVALLSCSRLPAEPVAVRYTEGVVHGFLAIRAPDGRTLADGDLTQVAHGDTVTCRLVFRFRDGSVQDETTVFSQGGRFRLLRDHLVQKGPAFPQESEVTVDAAGGRVTVRTRNRDGRERVFDERMDLPADVSNGIVSTLLRNLPPGTVQASVSMVVAAPRPMLVRLRIAREGDAAFAIGAWSRKAVRYTVKVDIGGLKGVLAKLLGKLPPDSHVFILQGDAPAFVQSEGPFFDGGPPWRIELTSPTWPKR